MSKSILSEKCFQGKDKVNEAIYIIACKNYEKLTRRCPLNQHIKNTTSSINAFVKLEMTCDNLGRYMRLKKIKKPLQNYALRRGINYIGHFFLKRLLLMNIMDKKTKITRDFSHFLFTDKYTKLILHSLFSKAEVKKRAVSKTPAGTNPTPSFFTPSFISRTHMNQSQVFRKETPKQKTTACFDCEIVRLDFSYFGEIEVTNSGLIFTSKKKDPKNPDYRLGPASEISMNPQNSIKKVLLYSNIVKMMLKRYNLFRQAVEILTTSRKSIFIILFSPCQLANFFETIKNMSCSFEIIENPKIEFTNHRNFTEEWKKKRMSSFEYLMKLNEYGGRSFQDLSQYPVFPWIIKKYIGNDLNFQEDIYRDLEKPIAAISDKKEEDGKTKYKDTEGFPCGRFQYGTHYMPGRVVLSYLMRLQPYSLILCRYDSGNECPARQFHILETLWKNISQETDSNYELIPEFYYNPEIFVNQ